MILRLKFLWWRYKYDAPRIAFWLLFLAMMIGLIVFRNELPDIIVQVAIAVLVISAVDMRATSRAEKQLKEELLWQAQSESNKKATLALTRLRYKRWLGFLELRPGVLTGAHMEEVNWDDAELLTANLSRITIKTGNIRNANLDSIMLQDAYLSYVDFSKSRMTTAILSRGIFLACKFQESIMQNVGLDEARMVNSHFGYADMKHSSLRGTDVTGSNLQGADLWSADLQGAILAQTNLRGADLSNVRLNTQTVLPDSSIEIYLEQWRISEIKYWTPETDISRYTDPEHPDFWQPEWVKAGFDTLEDWIKTGRPNNNLS